MGEAKRIVVTVHGIRTFGQWQVRLRNLIKAADPDAVVVAYEYGYFSVLAFIVPIFRWLAVRAFRNKTRALARDYPGARFSFVAHSFGTHIVAHGLRNLRTDAPPIDTIILCGSVLRSQFDWDKFLARIPARRVVNDCGVNDSVLVLSQLVVLFTGMAGRVGFYGFSGGTVFNRFFAGGHSHYFQPAGSDPDAFMRRNWLKLLTAEGEIDWV
jgi:predicted alpha/beta hydrolase family esterase